MILGDFLYVEHIGIYIAYVQNHPPCLKGPPGINCTSLGGNPEFQKGNLIAEKK
jgi:hypothetical protein